jgi:MFS family permease
VSTSTTAAPAPGLLKEAPTRRRYVVMAFLCVLSFLTYFDRFCITRAQEDIQNTIGITDPQMGVIIGAFWLAYALFEIPGGWMGDRWGSRRTLARIVLAWSLFTMLTGSATGFISLLVFRFLFGAGEAGAYPNMARVQANWLPAASRARAGGLLWLLGRWGGASAPILFGAMIRFFGSAGFQGVWTATGLPGGIPGWRLAFWAAGLIGLLWCVAFYPWFRDDPAAVPTVNAAELRLIKGGEATKPEGHRMPGRAWLALLLCPSLWALGLLYAFGSFGWSFTGSWLPRYLKDVHGVTFENSEVQSGLPLFCGGISCLVGGVLSDAFVRRTGRRWLGRALFPITGFLVAAVAIYCLRFTHSPGAATVLLCIAMAGNDFGQGANWATIVDIGGRYAGTTAGFINLVGNSGGNSFGPYLGALILGSPLGWNGLFTAYAATFLIAGAMWLFINPNRTFYAHVTFPQPEKETEPLPE